MTTPVNILIVDDHPLMRQGVRSLLEKAPNLRVAGDAGSLAEARRLVSELKPRLVLVDIGLSDGSGVSLIRELAETTPQTTVVVLSMHSAIEMVAECFQAGAMGYIIKESAGERLIQAVEAVLRGEQFLDSSISPRVIRGLLEYRARKDRQGDSSYAELTRREQQVLRQLAEGQSCTDIADKLHISRKTVENHRTNIMFKLNLKTPLDLVRYAMRKGLIDMDDPFSEK